MILITLLITFWTSIIFPDRLFVSSADNALQKAQQAFVEQKYDYAVLWYYYTLFNAKKENSKVPHAYIHYKLAESYYRTGNFDQSIYHIQAAIRFNRKDKTGPVLRYYLGRSLIMNKQYVLGELQLLRSRMLVDDPIIQIHISLYLARMYGLLNNREQMAYYTNQALGVVLGSGKPIAGYLNQAVNSLGEDIKIKSEGKARYLSTILPGAGQLYARQYLNSMSALLINTATTALLVRSIKLENHHHAILIGSLLWWRYYDGNRDNAVNSVRKYNDWQTGHAIREAFHYIDQVYSDPIMQIDISLNQKQF